MHNKNQNTSLVHVGSTIQTKSGYFLTIYYPKIPDFVDPYLMHHCSVGYLQGN